MGSLNFEGVTVEVLPASEYDVRVVCRAPMDQVPSFSETNICVKVRRRSHHLVATLIKVDARDIWDG